MHQASSIQKDQSGKQQEWRLGILHFWIILEWSCKQLVANSLTCGGIDRLCPCLLRLSEWMGGLNQGVWQHTYVQNAACNHFGSGQAGGVLVTGARRSDTGFLATLLQGLGILAFAFDQILKKNCWLKPGRSTYLQVPFAPHQIDISYQLLLGQGLDVSDAQQKERGKDGAVSWAHAFHGACEKEDLSDHGEKLFSKAYLLTRHPLDQTLGSMRSPGTAHTLSKKRKTVQLFDMYSGWMVIHDSLFDRNTGKRSQNCKDEAIPCYQWCDINMRVEERVHSRRKGFTFRRPLAEMTDVVFVLRFGILNHSRTSHTTCSIL